MEQNIIVKDTQCEKVVELSIIQNIHEIRGVKVILDFDLAMRYEVETRVLNQTVKRNIKRFPSDFMFQLTEQEFTNLKSQIVTSSWGGTRKLKQELQDFKEEMSEELRDIYKILDALTAQKEEQNKPYTRIGFKTSG